jgi:hypothetical protein
MSGPTFTIAPNGQLMAGSFPLTQGARPSVRFVNDTSDRRPVTVNVDGKLGTRPEMRTPNAQFLFPDLGPTFVVPAEGLTARIGASPNQGTYFVFTDDSGRNGSQGIITVNAITFTIETDGDIHRGGFDVTPGVQLRVTFNNESREARTVYVSREDGRQPATLFGTDGSSRVRNGDTTIDGVTVRRGMQMIPVPAMTGTVPGTEQAVISADAPMGVFTISTCPPPCGSGPSGWVNVHQF